MNSKLTDTGQQRAIESAAEMAAEKAVALVRPQTPEPSSSSDRMREIAEIVVEQGEPAHVLRCEGEGPACRLGKRIEKMEERLRTIEDARSVEAGEHRANARFLKAIVAIGTGVQIALSLWRMKHGG